MKEFLMLSPRGNVIACEGVDWSDYSPPLRERRFDEVVHFRNDESEPCHVCGYFGGVWLENKSSWDLHSARCVKE